MFEQARRELGKEAQQQAIGAELEDRIERRSIGMFLSTGTLTGVMEQDEPFRAMALKYLHGSGEGARPGSEPIFVDVEVLHPIPVDDKRVHHIDGRQRVEYVTRYIEPGQRAMTTREACMLLLDYGADSTRMRLRSSDLRKPWIRENSGDAPAVNSPSAAAPTAAAV